MAKKNPWEHLPAGEAKKVAMAATKKAANAPESTRDTKRKMVRISPEAHALAKKAAVLSGTNMEQYLEYIIRADIAARFPNIPL